MACSSTYCISNTGLVGADDNYITGGTYNGDTYWTGQTSGWTIYYYTGVTSYWCLSDTLGGSCYLTGKYPCISSCPDLSNIYVFSGICLTPTPTPTQNCGVLDFTAIFDCEYVPTPTPTPSASVTPTPTITPSSTNFCSIIGIEASGYTYTPTPTPTPTVTPTLYNVNSFNRLQFYSPLLERNCPVFGFAEFETINGYIICPGVQKFQDCNNGEYYYCNNVTGLSAGTIFDSSLVLGASVTIDGVASTKCIIALGMDYIHGNINDIEIISANYGYSDAGCLSCLSNISSSEICFYLEADSVGDGAWNCVIDKSGTFNGRPYYEIVSGDCTTSLGIYVWWNIDSSSWELTDGLGDSDTVYCSIGNPGLYPVTDGTYFWSTTPSTYLISTSILGGCPLFTPTGLTVYTSFYFTDEINNETFSYIYGEFTGYTYNNTKVNRLVKLNKNLTVDYTFTGGTGFNASPYYYAFNSITQQPDGKVIATGTFTQYSGVSLNRIVRLNTNGSIDNTFTSGGGFDDYTLSTAIDSTGKIIVLGQYSSYSGISSPKIIRLNSNGSQDATFNVGAGFNSTAVDVLMNPDNTMYITGYFNSYSGISIPNITKLLSTGAIDTSFTGGTGFNTIVNQPNGLMRISGETSFYAFGYFTSYSGISANRIIKLNSNGTKDTSFSYGTGFNNIVYHGYVIWDDKLLLDGAFTTYNGTSSNGTIVLNSDGTIYQTFTDYYVGVFFIGDKLYGQQLGQNSIELILSYP